jgi:hypothetical protein
LNSGGLGFISEESNSSDKGGMMDATAYHHLEETTLPTATSNEKSPMTVSPFFNDYSFEQSPSVVELLANKDSSAFVKNFKWVIDKLDLQHPRKFYSQLL